MLRKIRLTFAMICFVLITLLFLDFTGTLYNPQIEMFARFKMKSSFHKTKRII